jgi:hypothetical protein
MTIWRMCSACRINDATDAHSKYAIRNAFPRQQWLCEPPLLRLYVDCLLCNKTRPILLLRLCIWRDLVIKAVDEYVYVNAIGVARTFHINALYIT